MHVWAHEAPHPRAAGAPAGAYRLLWASTRPLWWAPHLPLLVVPALAGAPADAAWPLGLLLWASAGLVAAAAQAGGPPRALPAAPWSVWRLGLGALGLAAATAVAAWAGAAVALYGLLLLGVARLRRSDAL